MSSANSAAHSVKSRTLTLDDVFLKTEEPANIAMHDCWRGLSAEIALMVIKEAAPHTLDIELADGDAKVTIAFEPSDWKHLNNLRLVCTDAKKDIDRLIRDHITLRVRSHGDIYSSAIADAILASSSPHFTDCLLRQFGRLQMQQTFILSDNLPGVDHYTWEAMVRATFHILPVELGKVTRKAELTWDMNASLIEELGADLHAVHAIMMKRVKKLFIAETNEIPLDGLVFRMPCWIPRLDDYAGATIIAQKDGRQFTMNTHAETLKEVKSIGEEGSSWKDEWIEVSKSQTERGAEGLRDALHDVEVERAVKEGVVWGVQEVLEGFMDGVSDATLKRLL